MPRPPLALSLFMGAVTSCDWCELGAFARSLRHDCRAVRNGLTLHWNSGAAEGKNCKFKHIRRLMFGRANFDLLRKMTLLN
jgi:transposase